MHEYAQGGAFGELALLHGEPRLATVRATQGCVCWALDRDTFRKIMMSTGRQDMNERTTFLTKVPVLQELTALERFKIAEVIPSYFRLANDFLILCMFVRLWKSEIFAIMKLLSKKVRKAVSSLSSRKGAVSATRNRSSSEKMTRTLEDSRSCFNYRSLFNQSNMCRGGGAQLHVESVSVKTWALMSMRCLGLSRPRLGLSRRHDADHDVQVQIKLDNTMGRFKLTEYAINVLHFNISMDGIRKGHGRG